MNKKTATIIILILISIIILLFSILIFNIKKGTKIDISNIQNASNVQIPNNEIVSQTNSDEIKISPNALITFNKNYLKCNHTVTVKEPISSDMVNMTKKEFSKLYNDWEILKFTNSDIELSKDFNGFCDEHFLVKSTDDGFIAIYNINFDNSLTLKEKTQIALKYLSNSDIEELKSGIKLYGIDKLNAYIENFE